jgi:hypothetical protein
VLRENDRSLFAVRMGTHLDPVRETVEHNTHREATKLFAPAYLSMGFGTMPVVHRDIRSDLVDGEPDFGDFNIVLDGQIESGKLKVPVRPSAASRLSIARNRNSLSVPGNQHRTSSLLKNPLATERA